MTNEDIGKPQRIKIQWLLNIIEKLYLGWSHVFGLVRIEIKHYQITHQIDYKKQTRFEHN